MIARWLATSASAVVLAATVATNPATAHADTAPVNTWTVTHQTAVAAGESWWENPTHSSTLALEGTLSNSSDACYSLWTRGSRDSQPFPPNIGTKRAEICGSGDVDVSIRQATLPNTWWQITVCSGTLNMDDCAQWRDIDLN
ncbi:hypothetical protein GCM10010145_46820 [Streptomyces ruber]|uniref:Secreted protein n=2 Tax=Streptomyces TaxID=1883 RepID=A0A918EVJ2_9ACTN|nr:hypothetical protein GCM10010145_46820 [Streptomyces ruber]